MNASFYNGLVGMKSSQFNSDMWADNIANANTTGYKQQTANFSALFTSQILSSINGVTSNDIESGAVVGTTAKDMSQGNIVKTDNPFDLAISGDGFFVIKDITNPQFTRNGSFTRDRDGLLVNQNGEPLQVLNANNLKKENGEWIIDTSIDTTTLLTPNSSINDLTPITLPEILTFPAQATKNISIAGNLNGGDIVDKVETAKLDSDFGVLYDKNQKDMHIQEGESLVFGFGENISYENGLIKTEFCIADDPIDNKDVNIDFLVNGTEIKTTLKDGATKEEIKDAIAKELEKNSILYEKSESGIKLKSKDRLIVENKGDILKNSGAEVLSYKKNPQNKGEFQTIEQFINKLQSIADKVYPETTSISLNEKGQLYIQNNSDKTIVSTLLKTENSNQSFLENLGSLGKVINSNTATNSLTFNEASEGFTGNIIDSTGEKNSLKFTFRKVEKEEDKTIWNLDLEETDKEGNSTSTDNYRLEFSQTGELLNPKEITFDNNGIDTLIDLGGGFKGITSFNKSNSGFAYSEDGLIEGYLKGYDIETDGKIVATFSNNQTSALAQIPIFHFPNKQGLNSLGGTIFSLSDNSGTPTLFSDQNGNYIAGATIQNSSLETSNVDMSQAMTELIISQKAYEANSKSITTSDQFIQKAIDMKR